jgi:G3E family GTPase
LTQAIPITLLTGFLGSGKTTLLARLLAHPALHDTAVLVNELGEIGLDHHLLRQASETVVLMDRGCLCCALRSDLAEQLDDLFTRRLRGELPAFARVVIETTGLADPGPILQTLASEPMIAALYRLHQVIATVDAQLGEHELDSYFESVKQVAVADRLVLTKVDLVNVVATERIARRLHALNPAAPVLRAANGELDPAALFGTESDQLDRSPVALEDWLGSGRFRPAGGSTGSALSFTAPHDRRVHSFVVSYADPVSGTALWRGLETLIERDGDKLLRVKGVVNVVGQPAPRVLQIVQHVLYPIKTLPAWPDEDRRTRLVFIVRDLAPDVVRTTLDNAMREGC